MVLLTGLVIETVGGTNTVSTALELVTLPARLVTTTR